MVEHVLDASISEPIFHRVRDVAPNKVLPGKLSEGFNYVWVLKDALMGLLIEC